MRKYFYQVSPFWAFGSSGWISEGFPPTTITRGFWTFWFYDFTSIFRKVFSQNHLHRGSILPSFAILRYRPQWVDFCRISAHYNCEGVLDLLILRLYEYFQKSIFAESSFLRKYFIKFRHFGISALAGGLLLDFRPLQLRGGFRPSDFTTLRVFSEKYFRRIIFPDEVFLPSFAIWRYRL